MKRKTQCFVIISKHQDLEKSAEPSILDKIRGVWVANETLS